MLDGSALWTWWHRALRAWRQRLRCRLRCIEKGLAKPPTTQKLRVERPNRRLRLESLPRQECECDLLLDLLTADKPGMIFAIETIVYANPWTSLGTTRSGSPTWNSMDLISLTRHGCSQHYGFRATTPFPPL